MKQILNMRIPVRLFREGRYLDPAEAIPSDTLENTLVLEIIG